MMIKLEDIKKNETYSTGECTFRDHIIWLQRLFQSERACTTGEEYSAVCKLQEEVDALLIKRFG